MMKMTLSSQNMSSDRQSITSENRSISPTPSPRGSPKPSPRPVNKRDAQGDNYLSVSYKEPPTFFKTDISPISPVVELNPRCSLHDLSPLPDFSKTESTGSSGRDRKDGRTKKKSAWYSVLYPTYKSRSEDFKNIFKDVPDEERLVVDYSCAMQKEILVHGRLYVSQNYLCFYANIFGWETKVSFKWKEVSAITKEKTALVIPNAILISARNERFFFTTFATRDKTFMMIFRVWQNALMDRHMSHQEMWQLVHQCYGAELGLTSDDEDYHYIAPGVEDEKLSGRISLESFSEECASNADGTSDQHLIEDDNQSICPSETPLTPDMQLPTDQSDTTESDREKEKALNSCSPSPRSSHELDPITLNSYENPDPSRSSSDEKLYPVCSALHEGRQLLNEIIPLHVDQLFTLLFTSSKFFLDFHASRKTADLTQTTWIHNIPDNSKSRVISLTVALNQTVGPKTAQVTETQVMLPCSKAGFLYSIDVETVNGGIPYADSFCILVHYCIHRISESQSAIAVYAQIKYKKSVWGLVKGMIEKNCWQGLEDFFSCLGKALIIEAEETSSISVKRKSRRRRRAKSIQRPLEDIRPIRGLGSLSRVTGMTTRNLSQSNFATAVVFAVLILLIVLNILLYYKLWSLEDTPPYTLLDLQILKDPPKSHDEWIKLLQKQETLHTVEMQKWQRILKTAIQLLKQTEDSLNELQRSIHPTYTNKIMSVIKNHNGMNVDGHIQGEDKEL